jgi:predicted RNase H-like HicB family nuclease
MAVQKKLVVIVEKSETGFSAYAADFPVFTTGASMNELIDNVAEAFSLFFEEKKFDESRISLEIDFKQFFQYYKVINSKALAEKIGMNPTLLSQYVRGHKKPSEQQRRRILYGINRIGHEMSEMTVFYEKSKANKKR